MRVDIPYSYNFNAEYGIDGDHEGQPYFRNPTGDLIDYYNFQVYATDPHVVYPNYYTFTSPGPSQPSLPQIILGTVYTLWSGGSRVGDPHHLKVVSDDTISVGTCGSKQRTVKYQVVDSIGRAIKRYTRTKEIFVSITQNTCNPNQPTPSDCSADYPDGTFRDQLGVGCPGSGSCGFEMSQQWKWCPRGKTPTTLANLNNSVHADQILMKGKPKFSDNEEIGP